MQLALVFVLFCAVCRACLITNCPKGGKRAGVQSQDSTVSIRQCTRCGPAKLGHCYGPAICCGPQIGCLIATPETTRCLSEAASPSPCTTPSGAPCGSGKNAGRCAANGVCCTHESCHIDVSCHPSATDIAIGNTDQLNSFYNLYNVISSAYQQENPEGEQK